jgi:hypothetical protein
MIYRHSPTNEHLDQTYTISPRCPP